MLFPFTAGLRIILAGEYLGQRHYILHPKKFFLQSLITFYPVEEIFFLFTGHLSCKIFIYQFTHF